MSRPDTTRRRRRTIALVAAAGLLLAALLGAGPPQADVNRAAPEDFTHWSHFHELPRPPAGAAYGDFLLPPSAFGKALPNLEDLRLADEGTGKVIPYAIRVRRPSNEKREVPGRVFDRGTRADHSAELSIDLEKPPEYNRIAVDVRPGGQAYSRKLHVEGSSDGKDWSKVLDTHAVDLNLDDGQQQRIVRREFGFPPARYRYLRVRVWPDRVVENDRPKLEGAQVLREERVPGETMTREAAVGRRQPVRHQGQFASAWDIDLGEANVPVSRLTLTVKEGGFTRPFEVVIPGRDGQTVASGGEYFDRGRPTPPDGVAAVGGNWDDGQSSGTRVKGEVADVWFPEVQTRKLRLIVIDSRNPPLSVEKVSFTAPARQVIFPVTSEMKGPLRLYSGNEFAPPTNYDFAAKQPLQFTASRVEVGERQANPSYVPPPKPWTERWPYLADAILALACVVLAGLLMTLAFGAIRRHDAMPEASEEVPPPASA